MPATFQRIAPILPVRDVNLALKHYERLGFQGRVVTDGSGRSVYGFLTRGAVELHVTVVPALDKASNTSALYLRVDDPDALYEEWSERGVVGRLVPPQDQPWGMREMVHVDADGNLLRIGRKLG